MRLAFPAPAKLNLMLQIVGRRPDGYHELQTIIQFLDYCDQLYFTPRDDGQIILENPLPGVPNQQNLIVKAARLLQQTYQVAKGVTLNVEKIIPQGAGLGGGSSDAATTLVALNQLWNLQLTREALAVLGLQLGADVPVFIHGQAALAEGIGEILTPLSDLKESWFVVIVPPVHAATTEMYAAMELTRDTPRRTIRALLQDAGNAFEAVAIARYPLVKSAIAWLNQFGTARLTGSGAAVFAAVADQQTACDITRRVPAHFQAFAAQGLNHSSLFE